MEYRVAAVGRAATVEAVEADIEAGGIVLKRQPQSR
jgi:hypothetical protein